MARADIAMQAYMEAYTKKAAIQADPRIQKSGVIEAESGKLTGDVTISQVSGYYNLVDKITRELADQITALDEQMANLAPDILPFFEGRGETSVLFRDYNRKMSVIEGVITVTAF